MKFIINHIPVSSKNEYGMANGRMFLRADIKKYYTNAVMQLREQMKLYNDCVFPILSDIGCMFTFYVPDFRRDFINLLSAPADALQKAGIVKNDRQIKCVDRSRPAGIDKDNPRTEIEIYKIKEEK